MRKPPPIALVCAGKLIDSPITRFPALAERLGPVMSSSRRLASRFVNSLRAGYPADDYESFKDCGLILLSVPDEAAPDFVKEMAVADLDWPRKATIFCSTLLESDGLAPLAALGSQTASICAVSGFDGRLLLAEGDRAAITRLRPLLGNRGVKVVNVLRGHKVFYLAAATCAGPLLMSLLIRAGECLKLAGVSGADSSSILQMHAERTTRAFLNAGRKAYQEPTGLALQIAALCKRDPELGNFVAKAANLAGHPAE